MVEGKGGGGDKGAVGGAERKRRRAKEGNMLHVLIVPVRGKLRFKTSMGIVRLQFRRSILVLGMKSSGCRSCGVVPDIAISGDQPIWKS